MQAKWKRWTEQVRSLGTRMMPAKKAKPAAFAPAGNEHEELLRELRIAHREWACAQHRLDHVLGDDEVDYAIFALETAEKRYGMLLKQAKAMKASGFGVYAQSTNTTRARESGRTLEG
ncbi:DUF2508 family protein [Paenibacillus antri]|nr:DUF2508 family protein [Paenibacillus antri]